MAAGFLSVNLKLLRERFKVTSDNARLFDSLVRAEGQLLTLDGRPYIDELTSFGIFFTFKPL